MGVLPYAATLKDRIAANPNYLRRFSIKEYHQMIEAGILSSDDRVELLEGWIVKKMKQNPPYTSSVSRLARRISQVLPADFTLGVHSPVTLKLSNSEPEPDLSLARGPMEKFDSRHPQGFDICILIEVADAMLLDDRLYKATLYSRNKIPEFWLVNLVKRQIEVYTKPLAGRYQKTVSYQKVVVYFENDQVDLMLDSIKVGELSVRELMHKV